MPRHATRTLAPAPDDPEVVAAMVRRFTEAETSVKEFVEGYKIQTKIPTVGDGERSVFVPYVERTAQAAFRVACDRAWQAGRGAKIVWLKDRQYGATEAILRIFWERFCRGGGGSGKCVSRKDQQTQENFKILHSLLRQTPEWVWPHILNGVIDQASATSIALSHFDGRESWFEVITSGDAGMGRGGSPRWVLLDELAWWERGQASVGGLYDAWGDAPGNIFAILSTGNGSNRFKSAFYAALEGRSGFEAMFNGWLMHPLKRKLFGGVDLKTRFAETLGKVERYGPEDEIVLRDVHKATLEQLHWRRGHIDSPACDGDIAIFKREHPTTPEEAFLSTGTSVYPQSILQAHEALAEKMDRDAKRCELLLDKDWRDEGGVADTAEVQVIDREMGRWHIYRPPLVGVIYAWGADPAQGLVRHADGKTEGDLSVILMREAISRRIAAIFRSHADTTEFAKQIVRGSIMYGWARGYVEMNNHGHAVIRDVQHMELAHLLLTRQRLNPTDTGKTMTLAPGFFSSGPSKDAAVLRSVKWVRELGVPGPKAEPDIPLLLLREMQRFTRDEKTGKILGASEGHDDCVSAEYLCQEACALVEQEIDKSTPVRPKADPLERYLLMVTDKKDPHLQWDRDLGEGY